MITHPIQTQRALLTWQSPLDLPELSRERRPVGELVCQGGKARFAYLRDTDAFRKAQDEGFVGYPGLSLDDSARYDDALEILMRRLPPRGRADFDDFMRTFGLSPKAEFSDLSLLAYTGARVASDSFSISETFDGFDRPFDFIFDVAGYRYRLDKAEGLQSGDCVRLVADPHNKHDSDAVCVVRDDGRDVGFINRLQAARVLQWVQQDAIEAKVFRLNGRPQYQRLFILASVHPRVRAAAA